LSSPAQESRPLSGHARTIFDETHTRFIRILFRRNTPNGRINP
jgi:hypothetical protein